MGFVDGFSINNCEFEWEFVHGIFQETLDGFHGESWGFGWILGDVHGILWVRT